MKATFGHMGTLTPVMELILEDLGHESITPIRPTRQTLSRGAKYAPEFACIPEIVAKSIVPKLSKDYGIPVLTLFIDEQTGSAGVQTRLEAFVDLMEQRRSRNLNVGA